MDSGLIQGVLSRNHKAYFPVAQISSLANLVFLMLYLGIANL